MTISKWNNEFPKQLRLKKQMRKNGLFVWFSCLLPELSSLNSQKFCLYAFFADVSNKSKAVIAVYEYAFKSSRFVLLENSIGYYAMTYSLENISVWRWWISLNFADSGFFDILFLSILWTVVQTPIKNTIFWKSMMKSFWWI